GLIATTSRSGLFGFVTSRSWHASPDTARAPRTKSFLILMASFLQLELELDFHAGGQRPIRGIVEVIDPVDGAPDLGVIAAVLRPEEEVTADQHQARVVDADP